MRGPRLQEQSTPGHLIAIFIILTIIIAITGYFYYENQKNIIRKEKYRELKTIANLKVEQISNWRRERLGDARVIDHRV